jgi:hypothetical protein
MVLAAPVAVGTPATMAEGLHSVIAAKPAVEAAGAVDAQNAPTAPWKTQRTRFPQLPPPSFFIPKRYKVVDSGVMSAREDSDSRSGYEPDRPLKRNVLAARSGDRRRRRDAVASTSVAAAGALEVGCRIGSRDGSSGAIVCGSVILGRREFCRPSTGSGRPRAKSRGRRAETVSGANGPIRKAAATCRGQPSREQIGCRISLAQAVAALKGRQSSRFARNKTDRAAAFEAPRP